MFTLHRWIHGGGGGHPDPEIRRGPGLKFFFRSFGPQLGPQIKAGEGRGR